MDMLERHAEILKQVKEKGTVKISELSKELNTSRETIRKDIYILDKKQKLSSIRGGATFLKKGIEETRYGQRTVLDVIEKKEIAKLALNYIKDGNTIFLDYGTSVVELAKAIESSPLHDITVITNSLNVVDIFRYSTKNSLILLGGGLRSEEGSLSGPLTLTNIDNLYCNVGFFGCSGLSIQSGITNHYFSEVEVSKKMLSHSMNKVLLADHDKFNQIALYKTADVSELDVIITDKKTPLDIINKYKHIGIPVINSSSKIKFSTLKD